MDRSGGDLPRDRTAPLSPLREAFARLDTSGTGKLSRRDVRQRIQEFYFGDRPDPPGNWLFCRLPEGGPAPDGGGGP